MADNKFKTAAAKLLAQHKSTDDEQGPPRPAISSPAAKQAPSLLKINVNPEVGLTFRDNSLATADLTLRQNFQEESDSPRNSSWSDKQPLVLLFAVLGCAVAIIFEQKTMLATITEAAVGLIGGAVLGFFVSKKLH